MTKPFYQSKTMRGLAGLAIALFTLAVKVLAFYGIIDVELGGGVLELIAVAAGALGLPYAIKGRAKTDGKQLTLK